MELGYYPALNGAPFLRLQIPRLTDQLDLPENSRKVIS